jgi:hypothetical protein
MEELFHSITNEEPPYPQHGHKTAIELIKGLLKKNPDERMDMPEVQQHPFFHGIDWDRILRCEVQPREPPDADDVNNAVNFSSTYTYTHTYTYTTKTPAGSFTHTRDHVDDAFPNFSYGDAEIRSPPNSSFDGK